jgi:hypothetical protein
VTSNKAPEVVSGVLLSSCALNRPRFFTSFWHMYRRFVPVFVGVPQRLFVTKAANVAALTPARWKELFGHQTLMSVLRGNSAGQWTVSVAT